MKLSLPRTDDPQINDAITAIENYLQRVARSQSIQVTSPTTADQPFLVLHALNEVPIRFGWQTDKSAIVYATSDDKREWAKDRLKVRCSVANTVCVITPEA